MAETIKIGGELESTATGNVVAAASAIKDKVKNKYQSEINAETDASLADIYTKAETYNKTELNNMITTPNQQYVTVTATDQTTVVTDVLPATGAANTVYRVGNWDGSQFDASVYSEYAWNGRSYVHLSTKTQIGEVFDISAYHATGGELAKYADLAAALDSNNGGGVPQSLQKCGMSVKFVHSIDNKYVQYRFTLSTFTDAQFVRTSLWQGVDSVVTLNSKNLIESGSVANELAISAVYDVSAKNPTAGSNNDGKFESLSALLSDASLNTLIPTGYRKGGMSIKFICSDDNMYKQYRFLRSTFSDGQFANVGYWEGVTDEIKVDSNTPNNKSVLFNKWNYTTFGDAIIVNAYVNSSNNWVLSDGAKVLLVPCKNSKLLYIKTNSSYSTPFAFLTEKHIEQGLAAQFVDGTTAVRQLNSSSEYTFDIPSDAKYIYITYQLTATENERSKPDSIQVDGVEYVTHNAFGSINNKTDILSSNLNELLPISKRNRIKGSITSEKVWSVTSNSYSFFIEVTPGVKYQIQAVNVCYGVFLNDLPHSFYSGESLTSYVIGDRIGYNSSSIISIVPAGAKYLLLTLSINGNNYSPSKVIIDNVDYIKTIQGNLSSLLKTPVITFSEVEINELYLNSEYYDSSTLSSITTARFYRKYQPDVSVNSYLVGLLFQNSSSQTVIDTRLPLSLEEAENVLNKGIIDLPNIKYLFKIKDNPSETTYVASPIYLTDDVFTLYNSRQLYDISEKNRIIYKEKDIAIEAEESGVWIDKDGNRVPVASPYSISKHILLCPHDTIKVVCNTSHKASALAMVDGDGYKTIQIGRDYQYGYEYTATDFCQIVITYNYNSFIAASIISEDYSFIDVNLQFTPYSHIMGGGSITSSYAAYYASSQPIEVFTGDEIELSIAGMAGTTDVLSLCNDRGDIIDPIYVAQDTNYNTYKYTAKSNGYIIVSGNTTTTPKLTITRRNVVSDFSAMYENQVKDTKYIREKRYYADKEGSAIPENYGSVFTYNGDTKVNSNHINNAVVYPNGEIIACREGGDVVKIALDGTETVLLNIPGTFDWRGMFIDSNNNVYVSPHKTTGGGTPLDVNNRGIWRLPYNGSQFTQVLKLYNPESDIPTERQNNDDTIWTFCEDAFGHIYAGVYAHSVRANPSVYRSDDGGLTWTLASNLLTDGYCEATSIYGNAMHIHCLIYNKYDKALYCIVGEIETVFKSVDFGVTWENLHTIVEDAKGTTLIAVPDGILIGSDGTKQAVISKLYSDNKSVKTVGRMWHGIFFGMRQSDLTGWIYAFTRIESYINSTDRFPPIEANTSQAALDEWKNNTTSAPLRNWTLYHDWVAANYTHDSIHPTSAAIVVSKDNGETWEIIYAKDTNTHSGSGAGIFNVGYFKNGECACGMAIQDNNGTIKFDNPVIISEGKHKYTQNGIDLEGEIFIRTNTSNYIV